MAAEKVKNSKEKRPKEPGKVSRWFKDFFSELKKVTWPKFTEVLKQTGIVLLVTVIFLLVMMAFDALLGWFYRDVLIKGLEDGTTTELISAIAAIVKSGGGLLW